MMGSIFKTFVEEQISPNIYIFAAISLGFIGFIGFITNLLVIVIVIREADVLWTPNNVILINMVVGDLSVAALGNPISMASAIAGTWYWSHEVCLWYAWFISTMSFASIGNLTVMSIERLLLVVRPMNNLSLRHAYVLAFLVWIYALSLSLPPFFNWGSYGLEPSNISCSVSWENHDPERHNDTYIGFLFIIGFIIPVMIIICNYCTIIKILKGIRKRVGMKNRREKKVTKMVSIMIIAFLIAWLPYAILALAIQYFHVQPSHTVSILPAILAKTSICYNPIIYASMNTQFSRVSKRMFFRKTKLTNNVELAKINKIEITTLDKIQMETYNRQ